MNSYISVQFKTSPEQSDILVALLLAEGYEAAEEREDGTSVCIGEDKFDDALLNGLMKQYDVSYTTTNIAQQNWNAQWESSFEPVQVDDFAIIRASFHEPVSTVTHDIIITPKMSFGTGHHATTYLMIGFMQDLDFTDKSVIDFGTGTGVLAILAEKLGAGNILGIDNDEWSINNSEENIAANGCSNIQLELADQMLHHTKANIILANINLNVIIANLTRIHEACHPGALVLFSGLMTNDEDKISEELRSKNFEILELRHRNGWIALLTRAVGI